MEKLLEMAGRAADQAEVYYRDSVSDSAVFQDAKLHDIETNLLSGVSLRIIKDGKLGFAYSRNLKDRQGLIDNALNSLKGGVEANYDFPKAAQLPELSTYEPSVKELSGEELVRQAEKVCQEIAKNTRAEIMAVSFTERQRTGIMNTRGLRVEFQSSVAGVYGSAIYPGSGSGISRMEQGKAMRDMSDELLKELVDLYNAGEKAVDIKGGRMKVLFMPNSMIALLWRLQSGLSGRSLYDKISPVADKLGQRIFHEKLTIVDDPLNDSYPGARACDDEGVPCQRRVFIEKGVLQSFFYDLKYAGKLGAAPTGHGYRSGQWGDDPVTTKPGPALRHGFIQPGNKSFQELVAMMDRGLIIEGALGAHSGNIPNGDYSIGVSPGLYVEDGRIIGRAKNVMVAGNIYETLKNVVDLGNRLYPAFGGFWVPPLLFQDVSVSAR